MSLFSTNQRLYSTNKNPMKLETPLGDLLFKAEINNITVDSDSSSKIESTIFDNFLMNWNTSFYILDFLRINFIPILPPNMNVDKTFAIVWRIKAFQNLNIKLISSLNTILEGSPENGEHLIAQSFKDNSFNLSIGTEDEESIGIRAKNKDWVPSRFEFEIKPDNICYLDNGLEVKFQLLKDEQIQIQFLVAWSSKKYQEIATWYAVEQSAKEVLRQGSFY